MCDLYGIERRPVPANERAPARDLRLKQLRALISARKAERLKAIAALAHARVVAAAGQPGAVERPDGVAALVGQIFVAATLEHAGKRVAGLRVFPETGGSAGVLVPVEFLEPAAAPSAAAGARAAASAAEASGAGASASVAGAVAAAGASASGPAPSEPPAERASPASPPTPRTPGGHDQFGDSPYESPPSYIKRAWRAAVGDSRDCGEWLQRQCSAERADRPFANSRMSPGGWCHPPGCPCGRPTCPIPSEERIAPMEIE